MNEKPDKFERVVVRLSELLEETQYAIRGTASLVLQGLQMNVDDIDVLTDKKGALACSKLLKNYLVEKVSYKQSPKYRSYFGVFSIDGVKVEVYGEWQIMKANGEWSSVYNGKDRKQITVGGQTIWVTTIDSELKMFVDMGRWNAYHKIRRQVSSRKE